MVTASKKQLNKEIGDLGERIAAKYYENNGYTLVERNYWRKWGEIDLIVKKGSAIHFVEVKTVSYETKADLQSAVACGTWRPEERVDEFKLHQIHKALETWLIDNQYTGDWQIDVAGVRIVPHETFATVNIIDNIT